MIHGVLKSLACLLLALAPVLARADSPTVGLAPTIPSAPTAGTLSMTVDADGLSSLQWNGTEFIARGMPYLPWVAFTQPDGSQTGGDTRAETTVDAAARSIAQKYQWGSIRYLYSMDANRLFVDVTIQNTSSTPVAMFIAEILQLRFPTQPAEYDGGTPMVAWNIGGALHHPHQLRHGQHGAGE